MIRPAVLLLAIAPAMMGAPWPALAANPIGPLDGLAGHTYIGAGIARHPLDSERGRSPSEGYDAAVFVCRIWGGPDRSGECEGVNRAAELLGMTPDEVERIALTDDGQESNPSDH